MRQPPEWFGRGLAALARISAAASLAAIRAINLS
jgi:hypothetical protein